jgi:hypothetical protein
VTGALFLASYASIFVLAGDPVVTVLFAAAIGLAMAWTSALAVHLR